MTVSILIGDCRVILPTLAADSFDCVVTSPPYWGLRDYGVSGQIGLEPTMAAYLETMVSVCRELRRVLKPGGVVIFTFSNRMFYGKAISAWRDASGYARSQLVKQYFQAIPVRGSTA